MVEHEHQKPWHQLFREQRNKQGLFQDLWDSFEGHRLVFQKVLQYTPAGEAVCEMGSGRGYNLLYLAEKGYKAIAVDSDTVANQDLKDLATRFNLPLEVNTADFFNKEKLPTAFTIFNSGVMEHFSKDQIKELLEIWSRKSKYMILSMPFKSFFSNVKALHGDENFYTFGEIKGILKTIPEINLCEAVSYNYSFGSYNRFRKVFPQDFRKGFYKFFDLLFRPLDSLCGNELLLVLKSNSK